jgi:hypothetical protein
MFACACISPEMTDPADGAPLMAYPTAIAMIAALGKPGELPRRPQK